MLISVDFIPEETAQSSNISHHLSGFSCFTTCQQDNPPLSTVLANWLRATHRNLGRGGDVGLAHAQKFWHIQGLLEPLCLHNIPAHCQQLLPDGDGLGFFLNLSMIIFSLVSSTVYHRPLDFTPSAPIIELGKPHHTNSLKTTVAKALQAQHCLW